MYKVQRKPHNASTWSNTSSFGSEAQAERNADQIKNKGKGIKARVKHNGSVIYIA